MSTAEEIAKSAEYIRASYRAVSARGGGITGNKNLANLRAAVESIPTSPLVSLKMALRNGTAGNKFPLLSEIDDVCEGYSNPWIVGHYGRGYGTGGSGVYLFRKYTTMSSVSWATYNFETFADGDIQRFLENTYPSLCSEEIRSLASEISLPYRISGGQAEIKTKFFINSPLEMMGGMGYGEPWDGWKKKTGLSSSSTLANEGRVFYFPDGGKSLGVWTRTWNKSGYAMSVGGDGTIYSSTGIKSSKPLLVCCFISAD